MKQIRRLAPFAMVAVLLGTGVVACKEQGPMEKAGEKIDDAVDDVLHPNEGPLEKAGRKTDEAIDDVKEKLE
jgi:hypothetical protein